MMSCDLTWATGVHAYLMGKDGLADNRYQGKQTIHLSETPHSFRVGVLHSLSNKPLPVSYIHITCHLTTYFFVLV